MRGGGSGRGGHSIAGYRLHDSINASARLLLPLLLAALLAPLASLSPLWALASLLLLASLS